MHEHASMINLFFEYEDQSIPDSQILPKHSYKSSDYENHTLCYPTCNCSQYIPNVTSSRLIIVMIDSIITRLTLIVGMMS